MRKISNKRKGTWVFIKIGKQVESFISLMGIKGGTELGLTQICEGKVRFREHKRLKLKTEIDF